VLHKPGPCLAAMHRILISVVGLTVLWQRARAVAGEPTGLALSLVTRRLVAPSAAPSDVEKPEVR
jgi:hypothetical protein